MSNLALRKRLDRLDAPRGEYEHLSDEELETMLRALHETIFTDLGKGDPQAGYERVRGRIDADLPETWADFIENRNVSISFEIQQLLQEHINDIEHQHN